MSYSDYLETVYNGSATCPKCDNLMDPVEMLFSTSGWCSSCSNDARDQHTKRKMSPV